MTYLLHEQFSFPKDIVLLIDAYLVGVYNIDDKPIIIFIPLDISFENYSKHRYSEYDKTLFLTKTLDRIMLLAIFNEIYEGIVDLKVSFTKLLKP